MSSSPFGLFFAGKVVEEEVDIMSSSPSCLFLLEVFLSLCLGEEVNLMSSSPTCLFFAGNILGEEVDIMSSSPSCQFLQEVIFRLGVLY